MKKQIVNPAVIKAYGFQDRGQYTCVWDVIALPNGDVYASLCTEGDPAGLNARLCKLSAGADSLATCLTNRDATCQNPAGIQMPHSKIHTSLQYADGKLHYMTYTTSPAAGHEFWDVIQLFDDPVQGYPGSHFVIYDTRTGHYESWGTPLPRHMIYGGKLDPARRRYYYLGWLNSRLGYVDLDRRRFCDVGRISRRHSFIMFLDRRGRLFGATREGQLWRFDPDANRVELLECRLPQRGADQPGEIFIIEAHTLADGSVVGGCRGGQPLWHYFPEDGPHGRIESLGLPWPEGGDTPVESAWIPLVAEDGFVYYWTRIKADEQDIHLIRLNLNTREREDLGFGLVDGKPLGSWIGPGARGPDGMLYWGNNGYACPRVIRLDTRRLAQVPATIEMDISLPALPLTPTGPKITEHPGNPAWSDPYAQRSHARAIPVCGAAAPYGSCAITALAPLGPDNLLGATSGQSCRLLLCRTSGDRREVVPLFDTGLAGTALHTLASAGPRQAVFAMDPADSSREVPLWLVDGAQAASPSVSVLAGLPAGEGVIALAADPERERIFLLTRQSRCLWICSLRGARLQRIGPLCDRQLSPTLAVDGFGTVYGAERGGRIWRWRTGQSAVETLPAAIPCLKGRAYLVEWQAAVNVGNAIYGATSDGYLFRFEPEPGRVVNLGKPAIELGLRALTAAPDGTVYGAAGAPEYGLAHLFSYRADTGFTDLGQLDSDRFPFGWAVRIACAAPLPDGRIYFGEDDDISHLWEFNPAR